ncbi:MAG: acyltransferase [Sporocytophaga sp.]|uniref:acyltransferase family protein n=1 Tax=Sporocytophaga sp. TaxID=2231183 RepID=UPI001B1C9E68|nr:acyltransferase [Sporocytophaga sp.]MBO9699689.1 acyltransferase [Sporocytophaga sp.]
MNIKQSQVKPISANISIVLDFLRLSSALLVFWVHADEIWFQSKSEIFTGVNLSHVAVVVFFVLSGYVIGYTTTANNRGWRQYTIARLSRLYSVLIPAILITALIEFNIYLLDPQIHSLDYSRGLSWPRYILTFFFQNETWFLCAGPRMNGPLWSLSFEGWYYLIFGFWFYRSIGWKGIILPIVAVLCAGPKIMVLMPIWFMGYFSYKLKPINIKAIWSWLLVILFFGICGIVVSFMPSFPAPLGTFPLVFAAQFVTDWTIGVLVSIGLWFIPVQDEKKIQKDKLAKKVRKLADLTFPIYVLHFPFLSLWKVVFGIKVNDYIDMAIASMVVLIVVSFLGKILDSQRVLWTNMLNNGFEKVRTFFIKKELLGNK